MVKIDGVQAYQATSRLRKKDKASSAKGGAGFSVSDSGVGVSSVASGPGEMDSASEVASLSQLMALQEVDGVDPEARRALDQGEDALKTLEVLQNEILGGRISKTSLDRIVTVVSKLSKESLDPHLGDIVAQIKQRAMIEVAKIEMSQKTG